MRRKESMPISEFMKRNFKQEKENMTLVKVGFVAGATIGIVILSYDIANASTGIDASARSLYSKLLGIGKWIIIIKGGLDTISNVVQGNFDTAKKSFLSYLLVYLILQGLPWAMDEVDNVFRTI